MKIIVNKKELSLNKNNFLASGGEGDIYTKNSTAYKIYQNPDKMIPAEKIQELSAISNNNVIRPKDIIYSTKGNLIGYSMRFVPDTYALCQLFTKAFRNRNNIDHSQIQELIKKLYTLVSDVHSANILIVDLNEMNFLSSKDFTELFAIDTDSYQTKSYPATAIMDSIKDRHSSKFSKETDWFSYGIISFQLFTGIHPYKGKHPTLKTYDERMKNNISVFNKDVSIPKACYSFDVIPEVYKNWYKSIFDEGNRIPPPSSFDNVKAVVRVDVITGTNNLDVDLIQECDGSIKDVIYNNGIKVLTDKYLYLTGYKNIKLSNSNSRLFTSPYGTVLLASLKDEKLRVFNTSTKKEIPCSIVGQKLMVSNGSLYIKSQDRILGLDIIQSEDNIVLSSKISATILENASRFFEGVLVQNIVGSFYISIFPEAGVHHQIKIPELDNHKIIDAKYDSGVFMAITADKSGKYDRLVFRFDKNHKSYDLRKIENINPVGINFTVLDNGITICVNEEDNLEVFSSKKESSGIKIINDSTITADMKLFNSGSKLLFAKKNKLYQAKMK